MGRLSRVDWTETSWCWVVFLGDPGRWVELVVCSAQHMEYNNMKYLVYKSYPRNKVMWEEKDLSIV